MMVDFATIAFDVLSDLWSSFTEFVPSLFSAIAIMIKRT